MNNIARFEKVSFEQFKKDWLKYMSYENMSDEQIDTYIRQIYEDIKLPRRATLCSADYDFYMPDYKCVGFTRPTVIPTGIKCSMNYSWVLNIYPRSGHGFKYGTHLVNSVGIIDGDYYNNDTNEGDIIIKLINDENVCLNNLSLPKGEAFCQGVFTKFGITENDDADGIRDGGIGSTSKRK